MSSIARRSIWAIVTLCALGAGFYYLQVYPQASFPALPLAGTQLTDEDIPAEGFAFAPAGPFAVDAARDVARTPPHGMSEYRSATYRFSLLYPSNLSVKEYDEGKGAATITFQNIQTVQGFQIFIVPYASAQVSRARFIQDQPTGVMQSPMHVTIDGTAATSFYSTNPVVGDTAEIWFIRNGYLYEVTAPKSQAAWLSDIMNTWRFI